MEVNKIFQGNCLDVLKEFPDSFIDCIVTSPPYWMLRDYGHDEQVGMETTIDEYINSLCNIFDEAKRVLKSTGTCWVNLGDTYMNNSSYSAKDRQGYGNDKIGMLNKKSDIIQQTSLCLIPYRFAIEMTNRKWILRNNIIWHKPNCMPCSVKNRFTVDYENVFFFAKDKNYYFEQQLDPYVKPLDRWGGDFKRRAINEKIDPLKKSSATSLARAGRDMRPNKDGKNKRSVWSINTKPFKDSHFATFPDKLIEPMIKAGCPENGVVLDMFIGSGTTGIVALKLNRKFVGIELNPEYIKIANKRIEDEISMFN